MGNSKHIYYEWSSNGDDLIISIIHGNLLISIILTTLKYCTKMHSYCVIAILMSR